MPPTVLPPTVKPVPVEGQAVFEGDPENVTALVAAAPTPPGQSHPAGHVAQLKYTAASVMGAGGVPTQAAGLGTRNWPAGHEKEVEPAGVVQLPLVGPRFATWPNWPVE
jgi:hypothetical protein